MAAGDALTESDRLALDKTIRLAEQTCRFEFSVYVGPVEGDDTRAWATRLHNRLVVPARSVLVLADPPVPYEIASERLGRPIGSLGPSRRRCLQKMRSLLEGDATDPPIDHRGAS